MTMNGVAEKLRFPEVLSLRKWVSTIAMVLAVAATLAGQTVARQGRITQEISSASMVTLRGNVRADLTPQRDLGAVEDGMELRLYMVLQRAPEQQAALNNLLARQQQPTAAEYHKWLTPQQFGTRFGASQADIVKITNWLQSQGMKVNGVMNNATMIDFTASAGRVRDVFGTQLHYYNIQGGKYAANAQDPQIPAALAGVVSGIKGLSKIPPQSHHSKAHQVSYDTTTHKWSSVTSDATSNPAYLDSKGDYGITPKDYYTIYNVNPVFTGGNLGAGATIAVVEESDIEYGTVNSTTHAATGGDVTTFRTKFGVPGTLNMFVYHGYGTVTCTAPGIDPNNNGEEVEAALDAEWANALAPSAKLIFMSCDQTTDQGTDTSMTALIDNNLADVMSLSYGASELWFVSSDYTFYDTLYSQAAAQGQSIIISTGDAGSDVADQNVAAGDSEYCSSGNATTADPNGTAVCGLNVSGFSSSPLVTAAGGTDFSDIYDNRMAGLALTSYWGTNGTYYNNALGYVPETTWNSSCASSILTVLEGYAGAGYCGAGVHDIQGYVIGGSGGYSIHYAAPAYQTGITGFSNSMRAQPDVSMFASSGWWGHYLVFCDSYPVTKTDPNAGGAPCTSTSTFGGAGGTSFVAPSLAGIGGLLVTAEGRQGVLNPGLYALAKTQFTTAATQTACYANGQTGNTGVTTGLPANTCIFNDVTTGNIDVPCTAGSTSCYVNSSATYGILSTTGTSSLTVAYPATVGYDAATGIGSLNVSNLITNWYTAFSSTTGLTASPSSITATQSTTLTATVTGGVPTGSTYTPALSGSVNFTVGSTALGSCTLSGSSCAISVTGLALGVGADSVAATFVGSNVYPTSTSSIATVNVTRGSTTTAIAALSPVSLGASVTLSATVSPSTATGMVTFKDGSTTLGSGTISGGVATLTVAATTANGFALGSNSITAVYTGDSNYNGSTSSATNLSVTATTATAVTATISSIALGSSTATASYTATVTLGSGTPAGTVAFTVGSVAVGSGTLSNGTVTVSGITPTTAHGYAVGSDTVTATFTPTSGALYGSSSGTTTQTVTAPAYTITPPAAVSLAPGGSQSVTFTLNSTTFADNTTVTATSSSTLLTLSPASGTLTLGANGTGTFSTTLTASSSAANHAPRMPWSGGMIAFGAVLAGIPLARRRKRVAAVLLTALAISTLGFMMACGGSGGGTKAARTYTVTLTGTGGVSSVVTVTVQ